MSAKTAEPPNDAATPDRATATIAVMGDEAIDWFEIAVPPDKDIAADLPPNFRATGGLRRVGLVGGASLLREMVREAHPTSTVVGDLPRGKKQQKQALQTVARLRQYVEHRDKQPDRTVYRAEQLGGFVVESSRSDAKILRDTSAGGGAIASPAGKVRMVLVDDSGNGFRQSAMSPKLIGVVSGAEFVVIRMSRPLAFSRDGPGPDGTTCLAGILDARRNLPALIVLNVDDLRREGLNVSRRLSWERTAGDLARARAAALVKAGTGLPPGLRVLGDLLDCADVVVRIGVEGAVFLPQNPQDTPLLAFDPASIEYSRRGESGHMVGLRTCFLAALAAVLARSPTSDFRRHIEPALIAGLTAAARLFRLGYVVSEPSANTGRSAGLPVGLMVSYPYQQLFATMGNADDPAFRTVAINQEECWSLLVDGCRSTSNRLDPVEIVTDGVGELEGIPSATYGRLRLVDIREIEAFRAIDNLFREYHQRNGRINARDARPLSIAVFGQPGAGKSFAIKEVAGSALGDVMAQSEINLSQLQSSDQLDDVFFSFRNDSLVGKIPVVLFDECDARFQDGPAGWLKYFLMPMQDGKFSHHGDVHSIGPAIFVFIGGTKTTFRQFARQDSNELIQAKLPDFVSRLRGHVDIQGPNPSIDASPDGPSDVAYQIRRAVILRSVLEREKVHCPRMFTDQRIHIDMVVVRAFLDCRKYEHGTRSLEAIVGMSQLAGRDRFDVAALPASQQLRMHVDDSFDAILRRGADGRGNELR
jgi:hypothetical protein